MSVLACPKQMYCTTGMSRCFIPFCRTGTTPFPVWCSSMQQLREHMKERKEARRGVRDLKLKGTGPVYWRGKRVDPYAKK